MARRLISAIGAGSLTVALMLGISGCANPLEQVIEAQTGAKIDTDSGGTTIETEDGKVEVGTDIELPADFPAELPTPDATLVAAVSGQLNPDVNLVDTLNGSEFTVFAPVDDAFAAIDPATIEALKTDTEMLSSILTYHVVPGQIAPDAIVGTQTTVQGGTVEVTGSGDELMVNGANVICGGVHTANATVYLIDGVLLPSS